MLHNLILAKTAIQQSTLSPLSAPFNTIAGPSSASRHFKDGHLYTTYHLVEKLRHMIETGEQEAARTLLSEATIQENLLTATKMLTATTLLPHISSLANAPFLPNEALSSRVKKSGALLASEPFVFQFDRLKRASYLLLDEALSNGGARHLVIHGEIIVRDDAFPLRLKNYVCHGTVTTNNGDFISDAKINPEQQIDLSSDLSTIDDCLSATNY